MLWALLPFLTMTKHPIRLIMIYFGLRLLKMLWISPPFLTQEGLQSTLSFTMQVLISKHCFHFSLRTPHMDESFPKNFSLLNPKTFHNLSNQDIFPNTRYIGFYLVLLENYFWALLNHFPHPRKNTTCTSAANLKSLIWTYYSFKVIPNLRCIILLLMKNILANIHVNFISPTPPQKLNKISTWISFFAWKEKQNNLNVPLDSRSLV